MQCILSMEKSTFMIKMQPGHVILSAWQSTDTEEFIKKIHTILLQAGSISVIIQRNYLQYMKYFSIPINCIIFKYSLARNDIELIMDYVIPYLVKVYSMTIYDYQVPKQTLEDFTDLLKEKEINLIVNSGGMY